VPEQPEDKEQEEIEVVAHELEEENPMVDCGAHCGAFG
jgi:hypothetical protein